MTNYSPDIDADRLLQLTEEVSRIAGSLAQLSMRAGHAPSSPCGSQDDLPAVSEETISWAIGARHQRSRFLPADLFADPAWDILLDLLRAELAGHKVSVSSLCIASNVPATTGLRYITSLVKQGMIVRRPDPLDGRRVYMELSPDTSRALRQDFRDVVEAPRAAPAAKRRSAGSR